jgi:hypothetical protein
MNQMVTDPARQTCRFGPTDGFLNKLGWNITSLAIVSHPHIY